MNLFKKEVFITCMVAMLIIASCKKSEQLLIETSEKPTLLVTQKNILPTTNEEKQLVKKINEITEVIKEVFKNNNKAISEVGSLCKLDYYKDSYVFMRDIMDDNSSLIISQKNKIKNSGSFKNEFIKVWNAKYQGNQSFTSQDLPNFENINIYFPYQDKFSTVDTSNVTLVPAQEDGNEGIGYKLAGNEYVQKVVNDDYAVINPTFIIGVTSTDATPKITSNFSGLPNPEPESLWTNVAPQNLPAPPPPPSLTPPSNELRKVYIGISKCTQQYDALVSFTGNGGGSEIKYTRTDAYLKKVDEQVVDLADVISVDHSRSEIRDKTRKEINSAWDTDWEFDNKEQYFAIYEEDNRSEISWGGKLSTKVTVSTTTPPFTVEGEINFNIKRKSQDEIIRQFKITYRSYFLDGRNNQGHGYLLTYLPIGTNRYHYDYTFLNTNECPWPAYDWNSGVGFTWPYKRVF